MKKIFLIFICVLFLGTIPAGAEEVKVLVNSEPTLAEQIIDTVSDKAETGAKSAACHLKSGSKRAGNYIKDKSVKAGKKTADAAKKGGKKAKDATVKGTEKATNYAAKGVKHSAQKLQKGAEKVIDRTDKKLNNLNEEAPVSNCGCTKCNCSQNCECQE